MTKCDFCTQSTPKGKCLKDGYFVSSVVREPYCRQAIEKMTEALKGKKREG